MTTRSAYTAEEWRLLGDAPLAAAAAVALAEEGGGQRESDTLLLAWREAAEQFDAVELLEAIIRELDPALRAEREPAPASRVGPLSPSPERIRNEAVALCSQARALLARTATPREQAAYKQFVLYVATRVAEASRSGGFLGLGGVAVSLDEQATLWAIRVAFETGG